MKYTKETKTGKTINKEKTCKNPKDGRNTMSPTTETQNQQKTMGYITTQQEPSCLFRTRTNSPSIKVDRAL
jgi:hypothetical protein